MAILVQDILVPENDQGTFSVRATGMPTEDTAVIWEILEEGATYFQFVGGGNETDVSIIGGVSESTCSIELIDKSKPAAGGLKFKINCTGKTTGDIGIGNIGIVKAGGDVDELNIIASTHVWSYQWAKNGKVRKEIAVHAFDVNGEPSNDESVELTAVDITDPLVFPNINILPQEILGTNNLGVVQYILDFDPEKNMGDDLEDGAAIRVDAKCGGIFSDPFSISFENSVTNVTAEVPAMFDGVISDNDINPEINGIQAIFPVGLLDIDVGVNESVIIGTAINGKVTETLFPNLPASVGVVIDESLLWNGVDWLGFYVRTTVDNVAFSELTRLYVNRENGGGGNTELLVDQARLFVFEQEIPYVNRNYAFTGISVRFPEPKYLSTAGTEEEFELDIPNSRLIVVAYNKDYVQIFRTSFPLSNDWWPNVSGEVEYNGTNAGSPLNFDLFNRIGEGYIEVLVSYLDKSQSRYHMSKARRYQVDVIAPGGYEVSEINDIPKQQMINPIEVKITNIN